MNNDNNFFNEQNNYQQPNMFDSNDSSQGQNFSGVDNSYSGSASKDFLGEVPEKDTRPGCLTSLLGFVLTIALMITLTAGLILFGIKSSLSSGVGSFLDNVKTLIYNELANDTEMQEALNMVDSDFSDLIPEKMIDDVYESFNDALSNGIDPDNLIPELDYDYISDSMYDVTEKVVDEALNYYVDYYKTGEMTEEGALLDEFLVEVIGYDLNSKFYDNLSTYGDGNFTDEALEQAKQDTLNIALGGVKEEIDYLVHTELKESYEETFSEVTETTEEMEELIKIYNMFPMIMKACLIASAVIMLLQLIMYRQKYRAIRNISVVTFFNTVLFGGISAILYWAINDYKTTMEQDQYTDHILDAIEGFIEPLRNIAIGLFIAFFVMFIAQLIMRANSKRR